MVAGFVASRLVYFLAGVRFDDSAIHPSQTIQVQWQLLDPSLLRHDLWGSLWNLHSQPPLYNLLCGLLLRLPAGAQQAVAAVIFMALGLAMSLAFYGLLIHFAVRPTWSAVLVLVVMADPAVILYENWLSWTYPTAALLTVACFSATRIGSRTSGRWVALCISCLAAVVLLDSVFQWPWLVVGVGVIGIAVRHQWRQVLAAAAVPLLIVGFWYAKNAVVFGTTTTSSWMGMNLAHITLRRAPAKQITELVDQNKLSRLAKIQPFSPLAAYEPQYAHPKPTGAAATTAATTAANVPNFNNAAYITISNHYLTDSLHYIADEPGTYAKDVSEAAEMWNIPADQYQLVESNSTHITLYARAYDRALLLQATAKGDYPDADTGTVTPSSISWTELAITLTSLLLTPIAIVNRRNKRLPTAALFLIYATVVYAFVTTSLIEAGENMRFRLELGPLPLLLAAVTITTITRHLRSKTSATF